MLEESRMNSTEEEEELELELELGDLLGFSAVLLVVGRTGLFEAGERVSSSFFFRSAVKWRVKRETLGLDFVGVVGSLGFFLTTLRAGGVSDSALWALLSSLSSP
jgi:hypothetical protein